MDTQIPVKPVFKTSKINYFYVFKKILFALIPIPHFTILYFKLKLKYTAEQKNEVTKILVDNISNLAQRFLLSFFCL